MKVKDVIQPVRSLRKSPNHPARNDEKMGRYVVVR
jgi:hypothetical protein